MSTRPRKVLPPTQPTPVTPRPARPAPQPRPPAPLPPPVVRPAWLQPSPPPPAATPTATKTGWLTYIGLGWLLAMVAVPVILLIGGVIWFYNSEVILPGIYVDEIALGGLTQAEATERLAQAWAGQQIILESPPLSQPVTAADLGLRLDAAATADLAYQQGRSLATLVEFLRSGGQQFTPIVQFEAMTAQQTLGEIAPQMAVPPIEANIRFVGGRVEAVPAVAGRALDIPATIAPLAQNPGQALRDGRLALTMRPVEPRLTDVSGVVAQANALLAQPLVIRAYDPVRDETVEADLEPAVWGAWLSLSMSVDDPPQLTWSLDEAAARSYVTEGSLAAFGSERYVDADEVIAAMTDALETRKPFLRLRLYHHPQQHTVEYGETLSSIGFDYGIPYPWIEQANPGVGALSPGMVITIPSPDALLPLPIVENKRLVVSLSEQTIRAYENGTIKWDWPASTGISASPTAPGVFQVQSHEVDAYAANWNLWMPHFLGIYRPVPTSDFMNGFHGFPTRNGSTLLWTDDLGHPVTYGCILISSDNAELLYSWAEEGVVVEIRQ